MAEQTRTSRIEDLLWRLAQQDNEHAIILLDPEARVLWWSPGAEYVFSRSPDEMVGQPFSVLFTPEDARNGIPTLELQMAHGFGKAEDDRWQVRPDGSRFWGSGLMLALRDEEGKLLGYGKILRDRTDIREQLDTLRHQVEALTREDQQKKIFLATLAHELRNTMSPLLNAAQLVRMIAKDSSNLQYPIKLIERQIELIRRLVDDLSDLARISAGKVRLNKQTVILQDIVDRAIEAIRSQADERRHTLQRFAASAPIFLECDPDRLHQVLLNLIGNAIKYTPEGGQISVKATTEGQEAIIIVEDTGVGIPHEMLSHIFDLFTQMETPMSQGGLGIGLAVVKELVTLHGGTVQVRSDGPGKGSEFTVRLPLRVPEDAA